MVVSIYNNCGSHLGSFANCRPVEKDILASNICCVKRITYIYLVGAKLSVVLPTDKFQIFGASVADSPTERSGDFVINNTILHCTTAPGEPLIQKCKANIRAGCLPVIITIFDRVKTAFQHWQPGIGQKDNRYNQLGRQDYIHKYSR